MDSQRNQIQGNPDPNLHNPNNPYNPYPNIIEGQIPLGQPVSYGNPYVQPVPQNANLYVHPAPQNMNTYVQPLPQNGNPNYYQNAPAYGYQNQPLSGANQVYVVNVPVDPNFCNVCNQMTNSKIVAKPGLGTWLICLGLVLIGLCLCSWIPFCIDDTQDKFYFCTVCASLKGEKRLIKN